MPALYFLLGAWTLLVAQFLLRELSARRALVRRTADWREYEARRWARAVAPSIKTPLPFTRLSLPTPAARGAEKYEAELEDWLQKRRAEKGKTP